MEENKYSEENITNDQIENKSISDTSGADESCSEETVSALADGKSMIGESVAVESGDEHADNKPKKEKAPFTQLIFEWVEVFGYALAVMMILFLFVFRYVSVNGLSMYPTFNDNGNEEIQDRLIITNFFYTPKTGDVVVISVPERGTPLIKRVIAVGGQTLKINFETWEIWVDGKLFDQSDFLVQGKNYFPGSWMASGDLTYNENNEVELTVEEGKVFVMGDNRNNSSDSRFIGISQLNVDDILGRVVARVYPLEKLKLYL